MSDEPDIVATSLTDLAAVAPYLLGFQPHHSLVVLACRANRIVFAAAAMLPEPGDAHQSALRISATIAVHGAVDVVLIGYGTDDDVLPVLEYTREALLAAGITKQAAARVDAGRLWDLDAGSHWPPDGVAFDPATTVIAAQATAVGIPLLPDRGAVDAQLDPVEGAQRDAMNVALHDAHVRLHRLTAAARADGRNVVGRLLELVDDLTEQALDVHRLGGRLPDAVTAQLLILLAHRRLREFAATLVHGDDAHIKTWTNLTRQAHGRHVAGPAVLLALAALQSGNGALASAAVRRALRADPDDRVAALLQEAIGLGLDPESIERALRG